MTNFGAAEVPVRHESKRGKSSSIDQHALLDVLSRRRLSYFIERAMGTVDAGRPYLHNWHIDAMAHALERCAKGEIKRLIISVPPRHLKSIAASVSFPAWLLGQDPKARIICVSYSADLATKHARDCRAVIESEWYKRVFPGTRLDRRKNTETEMVTTRRGSRVSTSTGGTLTGLGGDIIIIDDPQKPSDAMSESERQRVKDFYDGTLSTRLNNKKEGVIILVMQRLHSDDLVAHVTQKESWTQLILPAVADNGEAIPIGPNRAYRRRLDTILHPGLETHDTIETAKRNLGSFAYSAQYQQNPAPPGGNLIKWEWFKRYSAPPSRWLGGRIVQSWDTASCTGEGNDWSVGTTWLMTGAKFYLLDVKRFKADYPTLRRTIIEASHQWKADTILIERASSGLSLWSDLRQNNVMSIAVHPEGPKISRIAAETPKIEAGQVFLPEKAPWLFDFKSEAIAFRAANTTTSSTRWPRHCAGWPVNRLPRRAKAAT